MKTKRLLGVLLAFVMLVGTVLFGTMTVSAADSDWVIDENGVLTAYNGAGGDITIPDEVTAIADGVFSSNSAVTSVTMPEVVSIGADAFEFCTALTSVEMPKIKTIGGGAFYKCSLTEVSMPDVESIGAGAFAGNTGLTTITVNEAVEYGNRFVFDKCTIARVYYPCTSDFAKVHDSLNGQTGVTMFCFYWALHNFSSDYVDLGNGTHAHVCSGCNLNDTPETHVYVDHVCICGAVQSMADYTAVDNALMKCEDLNEDDYTAESWQVLMDAKMSVVGGLYEDRQADVDAMAKAITDAIAALVPAHNTHDFTGDYRDNGDGTHSRKCTGCDEYGAAEAHSFVNGVCVCGLHEFVIEDGVLTGYNGLGGDVVVPDEVTAVADWVFYFKKNITSVTMPNVERIGEYAFAICSGLQRVDMPKIKSIGEAAFWNCALTEVSMPEIESLGTKAFRGNGALKAITVNDKVGYGDYVFIECAIPTVNYPCSNDSDKIKNAIAGQVGFSNPKYNALHDFGSDYVDLGNGTHTRKCSECGALDTPEAHVYVDHVCICGAAQRMADYTAVDDALMKCEDLNEADYSAESWQLLMDAKMSVVGGLYEDRQADVDAMAKAITDAIAGLVHTNHDFTGDYRNNGDGTHSRKCTGCDEYGAAEAHSFVNGVCVCGLHEFVIKDGVLVGYNGFGGDIVIPDEVTAIGDGVFSWNFSITSVKMPNVTGIGKEAFYFCNYMKTVEMPKVESIGDNAFNLCQVLVRITVSDKLQTVGEQSFKNSSVRDVDYPCTDDGDAIKSVLQLNYCRYNPIHSFSSDYMNLGNGTHAHKCTECGAPDTPEAHVYVDHVCICGAVQSMADYTAVDNALMKSEGLNEDDYTAESWQLLMDAKMSVVGGLYEDRQADVDAMAKAITDAIAALVPAHNTHDFTGDYRDNGDGTHSRKCTGCDEYGATEAHSFVNGRCVCGAVQSDEDLTLEEWARKVGFLTADEVYDPNAQYDYADLVYRIWRVNGSPIATKRTMYFNDVYESDYYYEAVLWGLETKLLNTPAHRRMDPHTMITRQLFLMMLYRTEKSPASDGTVHFTDTAYNASYIKALDWACDTGIVDVAAEGPKFKPHNNITADNACEWLRTYTILFK